MDRMEHMDHMVHLDIHSNLDLDPAHHLEDPRSDCLHSHQDLDLDRSHFDLDPAHVEDPHSHCLHFYNHHRLDPKLSPAMARMPLATTQEAMVAATASRVRACCRAHITQGLRQNGYEIIYRYIL